MSEMVERVKAAIESIGGGDALDQMNPDYDKNLTTIARAAIGAMRATDDMLGIHERMDVRRAADLRDNWNRVIDAALAEPKAEGS